MPNPLLVVWATVATALFVGLFMGWLFWNWDVSTDLFMERRQVERADETLDDARNECHELRREIAGLKCEVQDAQRQARIWRAAYLREMEDELEPDFYHIADSQEAKP
jgi:hypothetical protein